MLEALGPVVEAVGLSKEYRIYPHPRSRLLELVLGGRRQCHKKFRALQALTFRIEEGSTVGIVGRNGSGKSTLLQLIAGTLAPTSGSLEVRGRVAALLELGSGFNPDFTGRENVLLYGRIMRRTGREVRESLEEVLAFADIGAFADQPVKTYSSGMQVRLAFAAAIYVDPDLLLIDEALAVGDPSFQLKCLTRIEEFKKKGRTIVFVSHDVNLISQFCDRVLVLSGGELVFDGPPPQAINVYKALLFGGASGPPLPGPRAAEPPPGAAVELNRNEQRFGNGEGEVYDVKMLNASGQVSQLFLSNEEAMVGFKFRAHAPIPDPVYGMVIKSRKGLQVYMKNSQHQRLSCPPLARGAVQEVRFRQKLHLIADDYFVTLGVSRSRNGEMEAVDRRNDVLQFRVVGTDGAGIVNLDSVIELGEPA